MADSPITPEIEPLECVNHWRRVSADEVDVYVPCNVSVEAIRSTSRAIVFGRAGM